MKKYIILASAIILAGYSNAFAEDSHAQAMQQVNAQIASAQKTCGVSYPPAQKMVPYVKCLNTAIESAYSQVGFPYMDLIHSEDAAMLDIAAKKDTGKITATQAQTEIAAVVSKTDDAINQRDQAASSANQH